MERFDYLQKNSIQGGRLQVATYTVGPLHNDHKSVPDGGRYGEVPLFATTKKFKVVAKKRSQTLSLKKNPPSLP